MAIVLDSILKAIHNAVIEAQKISEQQHMRALGRYFYLDEESLEKDSLGIENLSKPKTLNVKLPFPKEEGIVYQNVEIPLIALNPPSSIKIKNMKVSFEANLTGIDDGERDGGFFNLFHKEKAKNKAKGGVRLDLTGSDKTGGTAKIEIEFVNSDVPETFARINDHLIKSFPF